MDTKLLVEGLAQYLCVVVIITFHEFGHAWMASKCGDDTARSQGRVTLNPASHIDPIGTILLPLLAVFLTSTGSGKIAGLIIGWGRPVPVNPMNFRQRVRDDILVSMAGPAMNVVLAVLAMLVARLALGLDAVKPSWHMFSVFESARMMAILSMFLFFFNLIPVPPLDGSHVMKYAVGMKPEMFMEISRYGFFIVIVLIQIPAVRYALGWLTHGSVGVLFNLLRFS